MAALRANDKDIKGFTDSKRTKAFCPKILSPAHTRPARLTANKSCIQLRKFIVLAD
jgi:hypothetical protein